MSTSKDAKGDGGPDRQAAEDIAKDIEIATRAADGLQLSDDELDILCDAVLSGKDAGGKKPGASGE